MDAFEKLEVYGGHQDLVQFKIVFASLLQGKPELAKPVLDAMKFPSDSPAYYFAHAAWGFAHKDEKEGNYWINTGLKVFGPAPAISYYDSLAGVGWVTPRGPDGAIPDRVDLATMPVAAPAIGAPQALGAQQPLGAPEPLATPQALGTP